MDTKQEWFLSLGMGFRGPFTTEEVQAQLKEAQVGRENLVWADGMHDWLPLGKVKVFEPFATQAVPFVHETPWMEEGEKEFSAILRGIPEQPGVEFTEFKNSSPSPPSIGFFAKIVLMTRKLISRK